MTTPLIYAQSGNKPWGQQVCLRVARVTVATHPMAATSSTNNIAAQQAEFKSLHPSTGKVPLCPCCDQYLRTYARPITVREETPIVNWSVLRTLRRQPNHGGLSWPWRRLWEPRSQQLEWSREGRFLRHFILKVDHASSIFSNFVETRTIISLWR